MLNFRVAACLGGVLLSAWLPPAIVGGQNAGAPAGRTLDQNGGLARHPNIAAALAEVDPAAVSSEEQGLYGARQLAEWLHEKGYKVVARMTDDIVGNVVAEDGYTDSTSMRIFAADPDNSPSRELGRYVWSLNKVYIPSFEVLPVWRLDRIGRGGDHEPYVTLADPGSRFTERVENYNRQHLPADDFVHVNFGYVANVARVNAMTVASLASAPPTPSVTMARDAGG